jgi:hypothetical protein
MARALADGCEPSEPGNADAFAARAISKICDIEDFDALRERHGDELSVPAAKTAGGAVTA